MQASPHIYILMMAAFTRTLEKYILHKGQSRKQNKHKQVHNRNLTLKHKVKSISLNLKTKPATQKTELIL